MMKSIERCRAASPWAEAARLKQAKACSSRLPADRDRFSRSSPASARCFGAGRGWQFLLLAALFALTLLLPALARAENLGPGGGTRIIVGDEIVGPYRLLFTVSPEPAQVGMVSFVVRLSDPKGDQKIRDAEIALELTHAETGATLIHAATHVDSGNPVDYAAHVQIDQAGQWAGVLRVNGPAGPVEVLFLQRVLPKRQLSTLIFIGIPFLAILGLLGAIWFMRSGAQQRRST